MSQGSFISILAILGVITLAVVLLTIISVNRKGSKLAPFERQILVFVAFGMCIGITILFCVSNSNNFFALFR